MRTSWITRIASFVVVFALVVAYPVQAAPLSPDLACVYNVNASATGANTGTSWANAYTDLQTAITAATAVVTATPATVCQIWVAKGTYVPSSGMILDKNLSFKLNKNVKIYGGFNGTEGGLSQRNLANNPTYLSGLLAVNFPLFTNSYHVVSANAGTDSSAVLDGFIIQLGAAMSTTSPNDKGGGIYLNGVSPTLNNLVIEDNNALYGGGMALVNSAPTLNNVVFYNNTAQTQGGGIYATGGAPNLFNATFNANTAPNGMGGGFYFNFSATNVKVENTIMWGDNGGEVAHGGTGSILYYQSMIQGCFPNKVWVSACGNEWFKNLADVDPVFVDAAHGNLRLRTNSSLIDQGYNNELTATTDLDGVPRVMNGTVDLGAYETPVVVYVNGAVSGSTHDGKTWASAFIDLQDGLTAAPAGSHDEVWVAAGANKPSSSGVQSKAFDLKDQVGVYGGFSGDETARIDRDWIANPTILSGDLNGDDSLGFGNRSDNSFTVVTVQMSGATLDGFTVQGGNNSGNGGGIYMAQSNAILSHLVVTGNLAAYGSGIFDDNGSNATLTNVTISENRASMDAGGLKIQSSSPTLINVILSGNSAGNTGGGVVSQASNPTFTNVTIGANYSPTGSAISIQGGSPVIQNTIIWNFNNNILTNAGGTPIITYSLIKGCNPGGTWVSSCGANGGGNVADADPLYVDSSTDNVRVHGGSPAVNAGSNALASRVDVDVAGDNRIVNGTVDLGAYELDLVYVNTAATGTTHNGASWATAYTDLQKAITAPTNDTEVWVATGTYKPTASPTDRAATFAMADGLMIYGGFAGTETSYMGRQYKATTLSGDINGDDQPGFANNGENSYHVVTATGLDRTAILDTFNVTGGNANGAGDDANGGGMINLAGGSPTLSAVDFYNNSAANLGGGLYNASGSMTLNSPSFNGNQATQGAGFYTGGGKPNLFYPGFSLDKATQSGGGLAVAGGTVFLSNVWIESNQAINGGAIAVFGGSVTLAGGTMAYNKATSGAGMYTAGGSLLVEDMAIYQNMASGSGGGLYNTGSSPTLINVSMTGNRVGIHGAGVYNETNSNPLIQNSILWGDSSEELYNTGGSIPVVKYSLIFGCNPTGLWQTACGTDGGGNQPDADPQFVNASLGNLRVFFNSPAIDTGSDVLANNQVFDVVMDPRIAGAHVDLGAFELTHLYVDSRATGLNNGSSWANAYTNLQSALNISLHDVEVWVAKGTYKPSATLDRTVSFVLLTGHMVYGGFAGTETLQSQRNVLGNPTLLSGDLAGDDGPNFANNSENSACVVKETSSDQTPILDGFTISGGNNNINNASGGGIQINNTSSTLVNLTITGNTATLGGGMAILNGSGSMAITNTIISGNTATNGGGVYILNSSPVLNRVTFSGNSAVKGGGVFMTSPNGYPLIVNSVFSNNNASGTGGAIQISDANARLMNTSLYGNTAPSGGGIDAVGGGSSIVTNDILFGDPGGEAVADQSAGATTLQFNNSLVSGCNPGGAWVATCGTNNAGNLADADPKYVDPVNGNLRLQRTSPVIDMGNSNLVSFYTIDRDGNPRLIGGAVDLGAYELIYYRQFVPIVRK